MRLLSAILLLLSICELGLSQKTQKVEGWESKPIESWDARDVDSILKNSAWSRIVEGHKSTDSFLGTMTAPTSISYTLRSALNVRYAIIRKRQIESGFDTMSDAKKAEFTEKNRALLDCPACEKYYVIVITCDCDLLRNAGLVKGREKNIFLSNDRGERRQLANFTTNSKLGVEATFYFPRFDSKGSPLIVPGDKRFTFNFENRSEDDAAIKILERLEFDVAAISREGQVIF